MNSTQATFDIRNFSDRLTATSKKDRYICPVCGGNNLTINQKDGAYQCWNECKCKDIREAIAPWDEVKGERSLPTRPQQKPKPKAPLPALIPDDAFELAKLPHPVESPARVKKGNKAEIIYPYSNSQWVLRVESQDGDKKTYPYHVGTDGKATSGKGDAVWEPYRMDEVRTLGFDKWVLGNEGEKSVEAARQLGLVNFTLQGASWGDDALIQAIQSMKDAGVRGVVYFPDHDNTGYSKAEKMALAAAKVGLPFIQINPVRLWAECPNKGDIADWVKLEMNTEEFIRRLEQEIHQAVEERRRQPDVSTENDAVDVPDSASPKVTFLQQALDFLYGDKPWISVDDKLYYWNGTNYKHSPDAVQRPRIASFCNSYAVAKEDKHGNVTIDYPFAKPSKVREVLQWVKDRFEVDPELLNPPGLNCTNGVLQIVWNGRAPGSKLIDHDPAFYYTYEPVVTYNPDADPTDCDRLLSCLDKPQQEIFLRTIAASLDLATVRSYKGRLIRGLLLKGDGNNGKDSLREVVSLMYGRQGLTGCTLSDFKAYEDGRKFPLSRLKDSRVNWATENSNVSSLDNLQSLKAFLTGDTLSAEIKGKDELDYNPTAVGLFNINDVPRLQGTQEAIASRWAVLAFYKTFKIGADPAKGEIEADPRFKYDPEFLHQNVLPAFLNRVLEALVDLMRDGIDYSCTQKALADIQRENGHLFQFCQDVGLSYDPSSTVLASDIWNLLEQWYQDNGTLTYESGSNGKRKAIWNEQPRKFDANVKAVNQVIARFSVLFPKAKVVAVPREGGGKPRMGLQGIGFTSPPGVTQFTPDVTQSYPSNEPNKSLQDNGFNPSNPNTPTPGRENEKIDDSMNCSDESSMQSSAIPPNLGEVGENINTASITGCSTGLKLGYETPKLGYESDATPQFKVGQQVKISHDMHPDKGRYLEVKGFSGKYLSCEHLGGKKQGQLVLLDPAEIQSVDDHTST